MPTKAQAGVDVASADWSPPREFGEYQILHLIGRGRMGQVYLAFDQMLARHVAVKFVSAAVPNATARERFLTEARAAARLQHPNVLTIHRVGELGEHPYIISEFIRGETLDRVTKPMPWRLALTIGIDLARGLAAAHRAGVLHRDIKPANAIVAEDGRAKLLDFGLAKLDRPRTATRGSTPVHSRAVVGDVLRLAIQQAPDSSDRSDTDPSLPGVPMPHDATADRRQTIPPGAPPVAEAAPDEVPERALTSIGAVLGTPDYMAPEIFRGEIATRQSDIYALGALLFELCSGAAPYSTVPLSRLGVTVQRQDAPALATAVPGVDAGFAAIVDRCLCRDGDRRYPSGNELREALEAADRANGVAKVQAGNPYRGLRTFEAEHRPLFFGRDDDTGVVIDRLRSEPFVLLVGDSGVGKSSICRAGVLPLIDAQSLGGGRKWTSVSLTPGPDPVASIASALAGHIGFDLAETGARMHADAAELAREVQRRLGEDEGLVWFIDQFEELVVQSDPKAADAADRFLATLAGGLPGLRVLATARADLLTRLASLQHLGPEIARAICLVRPLSADKTRDAIVGPARATGIDFESEKLIAGLVASVGEAGSGLPLLQFALSELWEARDRSRQLITEAVLHSIGGVAGALSRHADTIVASLRPSQQQAARRMMLRLVSPKGTRLRRREAELTGGDPVSGAALDALVRGRLIVAHAAGPESELEIAHEILVADWETLKRWLREQTDQGRILDRLAAAAGEWVRLDRAGSALWNRQQVNEAASIALDQLAPQEAQFLDRSRRAARSARIRQLGVFILGPLLVGAVFLVREIGSREATRRRADALTTEARDVLGDARKRSTLMEQLQRKSFTLFDQGARIEGQTVWATASSLSETIDREYARSSQTLEAALMLDHRRADVRALLGDALLDRALLAERDRRPAQQLELVDRLAVYDESGERRARLEAHATLRVETNPPGAHVQLARFVEDKRAVHEVADRSLGATPTAAAELIAGSYLLLVDAPGRAPVRYPIRIGRGESSTVALALPLATAVSPGFVYIAGGHFFFGSAAEESVQRGFFDTAPQHEIEIPGYIVGRDEVTVAEWIEYLGSLPPQERERRRPQVAKQGFSGALRLEEDAPGSWRYTFQPGEHAYTALAGEPIRYRGRHARTAQDWRQFPVTGISAEDALAYTAWLSATGRVPGARLCTEYEWERAARGADDREFPHGNRLLPDDANHDQTYGRDPQGMGPDEVGSHPASNSPFGLRDMAGNAFEWTTAEPPDGTYVARGGSFFYDPKTTQIANRQVSVMTLRDATLGLRVCASARSSAR